MLYIFIGYILVFFHLKINGFDLLMDFVGFFMIYAGLKQIANEAHGFEKAMPWAMGLGIVNLFGNVISFTGFAYELHYALVALNLLTVFAAVYLLYLIGEGVFELERNIDVILGAEKLRQVWIVQAVTNIGASILSLIPTDVTVMIALGCAVVCIIANIIFLVYWHGVRKTYEMV